MIDTLLRFRLIAPKYEVHMKFGQLWGLGYITYTRTIYTPPRKLTTPLRTRARTIKYTDTETSMDMDMDNGTPTLVSTGLKLAPTFCAWRRH